MMRIVTVIILNSFAAQATQDNTDGLVDKLADRLIDKLFGIAAKPVTSPFLASSLAGRNRPQFQFRPNFQVNAMPAASVFPKTSYQPRIQDRVVSVSAMQDTLKGYGIGSSPMQKLALTAIAGTRDASMAAQANRIFQSMDSQSRGQLVKASAAAASKAEQMAGNIAPLGFWDPWGFCTDADEGQILFYREIELKHGRICMLATLGMIVGEKFSPIFGGEAGVPAVQAAKLTTNSLFWPAVVFAVASLENNNLLVFGSSDRFAAEAKKQGWTIGGGRVPGDFGFDPLRMKPKDPKKLLDLQNKEILNGRLAMIAAAGIISQELMTGKAIFS